MLCASDDEKRGRLAASLAGALTFHAAALALTYSLVSLDPVVASPPAAHAAPIEVDLDDRRVEVASTTDLESPFEREGAGAVGGANSRAEHRVGGGAGSIPAPAERGQPHDDEEYSLDPSAPAPSAGDAPAVNLGIAPGSWSLFVDPTAAVRPPPPPTERIAPPASTTGGLAEALEARDHELGLGPAGRVLSAAHEAGHSEVAPAIGTATFSITVLGTGAIQIDLTRASSNVAAWRKVADKMAAAIKKKPPRIDGGRRGVRIALELVAEERWPNGAPARSEGPSVVLSGGSLRPTEKAIEDLQKRNPAAVPPPASASDEPPLRLNGDPLGIWVSGRGKVCSYRIGITALGPRLDGGCEPSNIGARPTRVVSVKVTNQTML